MSDITSTLIEIYVIALLGIGVLSLTIYWEIIERKTEVPWKPSTVKDVKREQHASDLPKPRGNRDAVRRSSTNQRRRRIGWTVVHSGRRSAFQVQQGSSSIHRRQDRTR